MACAISPALDPSPEYPGESESHPPGPHPNFASYNFLFLYSMILFMLFRKNGEYGREGRLAPFNPLARGGTFPSGAGGRFSKGRAIDGLPCRPSALVRSHLGPMAVLCDVTSPMCATHHEATMPRQISCVQCGGLGGLPPSSILPQESVSHSTVLILASAASHTNHIAYDSGIVKP